MKAVIILIASILSIPKLRLVRTLNHGRDAARGEFPFVVRIVVVEEAITLQNWSKRQIERAFEPTIELNGDEVNELHNPYLGDNEGYSYASIPLRGNREAKLRNSTDINEDAKNDNEDYDVNNASSRHENRAEHEGHEHHEGHEGHEHHEGEPSDVGHIVHEGHEEHDHSDEVDAGRIAAGVLITSTRVLTTCDSVGFFTGQTVNLHNISRISLVAGSILKCGTGGQFRVPVNSSVHPNCYSLLSGIILFNYGLYEIRTPFTTSSSLRPAINSFKNRYEMKKMIKGQQVTETICQVAGWGYPRKEFEGKGMPDRFEASSNVLQATNMTLIDFGKCYDQTCEKLGNCIDSIWEFGFVCAVAEKGGPCMNDKGAPLVCHGEVVGIHTNQYFCDDEGLPRHFLRLDLAFHYVYGIQENSGNTLRGYIVPLTVSLITIHYVNF